MNKNILTKYIPVATIILFTASQFASAAEVLVCKVSANPYHIGASFSVDEPLEGVEEFSALLTETKIPASEDGTMSAYTIQGAIQQFATKSGLTVAVAFKRYPKAQALASIAKYKKFTDKKNSGQKTTIEDLNETDLGSQIIDGAIFSAVDPNTVAEQGSLFLSVTNKDGKMVEFGGTTFVAVSSLFDANEAISCLVKVK
jgi:hypothetical protein